MNTSSLTQHEYHAHFGTYGKFVEKKISASSTTKEICSYAAEEINYATSNLLYWLDDMGEAENAAYYMNVLLNAEEALRRLENNL